MKKTIIALAAASSVALSHGVAVAEEPIKDDKVAVADQNANGSSTNNEQGTTGSSSNNNQDAKGSSDRDLGREIFGWKDGTQQAKKDGKPVVDDNGNAVLEEKTPFFKKFTDVAAAIAGVVALLGSISALIANIEKIAKQFMK